ncbi:MAG: DUF3458 domain-containing protein [Syntrophotaleaceae bacterium]
MRTLRTYQFAEDAGPLAHAVRPDHYQEINNFYTATVYNKGAELVRMLHTMLGNEAFIRAVRLYLHRHDGQAATVEDFLAAMDEVSDIDLQQFRLWYQQAGTPQVTVSSRYEVAGQVLEVTFEQSCPATPGQPHKKPLHIPCVVGLFDDAGRPLPVKSADEPGGLAAHEKVIHLRQRRETLRFDDVRKAPNISLFRRFSAPVRVVGDESAEALAFLLGHDSDPFNRWDAGQRLAERIILALVKQPAAEAGRSDLRLLIESFDRLLGDTALESGLVAKLLELPSELYLAQQMPEVDIEGLYAARQQVRLHLATALEKPFLALWNACQDSGPYHIDPEAVGRRSLKNCCLDYLFAPGSDQARDLVCNSYWQATNMTDRLAALLLLSDDSSPERQQALDHFFARANNDPLVLDKWFAVQARCKRPDTLQQVRNLLQHPAYQSPNPNRVRALIGTFSRLNLLRFHAADGSGYALLGEQVVALDALNPQLAGYLAGGFSSWRRYDEGRRKRIRRQLSDIAALPKLSRDLSEVVGKMLG